jgi:hypothetical protein
MQLAHANRWKDEVVRTKQEKTANNLASGALYLSFAARARHLWHVEFVSRGHTVRGSWKFGGE